MNVEANKVCGKCLARMRKASGLTQIGLAEKLGVPQSFVSKVETGERSLRLYEQFAYADALGVGAPELARRLQRALDKADALRTKSSGGGQDARDQEIEADL